MELSNRDSQVICIMLAGWTSVLFRVYLSLNFHYESMKVKKKELKAVLKDSKCITVYCVLNHKGLKTTHFKRPYYHTESTISFT